MSLDLANAQAGAGARAGQLYLSPQEAAAQSYSQYQGYSPFGSALSGLGSTVSGGGFGGFSSLFGGGGGYSAAPYAPTNPGFGSQQGGYYGSAP
jgi:hypothetical protein